MALRSYYVRDGDTIDGIALRETGNAANWKFLAEYNALRYPYISNDIRDYYGPTIGEGVFSAPISAGDTSFPLSGQQSTPPNPLLIEHLAPLVIGQVDRRGNFVYDVLAVEGFNAVSGIVSTSGPATNNYEALAHWYLYPFDRPDRVLRSADVLLIPVGDIAGVAVRPVDKLVDFLGTDLDMDNQGFLSWDRNVPATGIVTLTASPPPGSDLLVPQGTVLRASSTNQFFATTAACTLPHSGGGSVRVDVPVRAYQPGLAGSIDAGLIDQVVASMTSSLIHTTVTGVQNGERLVGTDGVGDIATATGVENLRQALLHRLSTMKGEMVNFPGYGNDAFSYLGVPNDKVQAALIEAAVIGCLSADDRVGQVTGGGITRFTDGIQVDAEVSIKTLGYKVSLRELQLLLLR